MHGTMSLKFRPPIERGPFRVLFNGRVEANKGVFDLVSIAASLAATRPGEFHFDVCGDGSALEELRIEVVGRDLQDLVSVHRFAIVTSLRS